MFRCNVHHLVYWFLFGCGLLLSCRDKQELVSFWADQPITVDGIGTEWRGKLAYLDGDIDAGFANDSNFLYITLNSPNRHVQMQILENGLMLWFSPAGNNHKNLGIKFPLEGDPGLLARQKTQSIGTQISGELLQSSNKALQIFESRKQDGKFVLASSAAEIGIIARLALHNNRMTAEIKIPLHETTSTPFAAAIGENGFIEVAIETPESSLAAKRQRYAKTQEEFSSTSARNTSTTHQPNVPFVNTISLRLTIKAAVKTLAQSTSTGI